MTMVKLHSPVQKSINSIFDEFFNELPSFNKTVNNLFAPPANIGETPSGYLLELSVPGRNKEDFSITVDKGILTVAYEKKEDAKQEGYKLIRNEFNFPNFKRSFSVDESIQTEGIEAKYENGILKLYLPKKAEVKEPVKSINVQ